MSSGKDIGALVSRILIAALFVPMGIKKAREYETSIAYNIARDLPFPEILTFTAIALPVGAGLALLVGFRTTWAALLLALFTAVWSLLYHSFWALPDALYAQARINFFKNAALIGGFIMIAIHGPGRFSLDHLLPHHGTASPSPGRDSVAPRPAMPSPGGSGRHHRLDLSTRYY